MPLIFESFSFSELEQLREATAMSLLTNILELVTHSETANVAMETHTECQLQAALFEEALIAIVCEVVEVGVCEGVRGVCEEAVEQAKQDRQDALEAIQKQFFTIQLRKIWKR